MFTKAAAPEKLIVRVLQQRDPEVDGDCLEDYCKMMATERGEDSANLGNVLKYCPYVRQVYIHEIHAKDAAGPTWARGLLSKDIEAAHAKGDLNPQDHCMSIDSHMDFEPKWDDRMVQMWEDSLNEYAVLSTYVQDVEHLGEVDDGKRHSVPHLCMITYTSNVRTHATKCATNLSKPKLTNAVWGAGLSFSKCHAELKVMVDPHTPHIFDGEEFNRAARFFTHGYDVYTPNKVFVLHDYHKSQSNPIMHAWHANKNVHGSFKESNKRLRTMIDLPNGEQDPAKVLQMKKSKFGLGDRRSLDQLINFTGFDLRNEKISIDGKNRCGNIRWVPFEEHPKGVNYIPRFDNETEDPLDPYDPSSIWYEEPVDAKNNAGDDGAGLPENFDLGKQHAAMEEAVEVEEVVTNGLDEKHKELLKEIQDEEEVENNVVDEKHNELVKEIEDIEEKHEDEEEVEGNEDPNIIEEEAAIEKLQTPIRKTGPLRGMKEKMHHGAEALSGIMAKHPKIEHGFSHLPFVVKFNVFFLIVGVVIVILKNAGTGRAFKKNRRKRAL